jgi:hypothetical protein
MLTKLTRFHLGAHIGRLTAKDGSEFLFSSFSSKYTEMADINVKFYQTKDSTVVFKETDTRLTAEGKLPVASLEKEFGVNTLKEIDNGKAFLIGADEHGHSDHPFTGKTMIKVTGERKGKPFFMLL